MRGEAKVKKLSARPRSLGAPVTKYTLTSWTVKSVDLATGEEIYFNTTLPQGVGSWNSEEEALKAIGAKIADEFSRDFFLQHANVTSRKVALTVDGLPDAATEDALGRELVGLPAGASRDAAPAREAARLRPRSSQARVPPATSSPDPPAAEREARPAVLQRSARVAGDTVNVAFDKACADAAVLSRLETNPPAGLYGAPPERQKSVIKDPGTLRKLTT